MVGAQRKRVVVICDDDEPIAVLLRDAVNDQPGYQAVVAPDGALLLDTVRQVHADLLILDIMMPGPNGPEIYDGVREDAHVRDTAVFFASAAARQFEPETTKRRITDVIPRPFDLNDLLQRARTLWPAHDAAA